MTEVVYDFASSYIGEVTLSPYEVVDNVSAPTADRDIVFEGDINEWLFNNGILCPTLSDEDVQDGATLLDALSDATTHDKIVLAVERLKEAWTGYDFAADSKFQNNLRFNSALSGEDYWFVDQVSSVNVLGAFHTTSAPCYRVVEQSLYDLFSDGSDTDVDANSATGIPAPEIETLTGLQTLKYNHAKVVAWMSLQTLGTNPNADLHKQALGMESAPGVTTPDDAWFSKTLADVVFTPAQLTEILNTVASHGSRISDDGTSKYEFKTNDTITVVANVTDGRPAKTGSTGQNVHKWKIMLRQKPLGEVNPQSTGGIVLYRAFGHQLNEVGTDLSIVSA